MRKTRTPNTETLSVPQAGARYFGLSRNASYEAARRGDLPTIDVGRLKRVPVRTMERKLDRITERDEKPVYAVTAKGRKMLRTNDGDV